MEDSQIKRKIESLDGKMPDVPWSEEELWSEIDQKLNAPTSSGRLIWYGIAASILLIVAISLIFSLSQQGEVVNYTTEIAEAKLSNNKLGSLEQDAREFIDAKCLAGLEICTTPRFVELYNELQSLDTEKSSLEEMISKYGEDPSLLKSRVRIENREVLLTNALVKIILS